MGKFTTDPIETLPEWNAVLANGCCCTMPSCPVPLQECESISVERSGDYYVPFTAPSVDPYAEIPRLYLDVNDRGNIYHSGTAWTFSSYVFEGGDKQYEGLTLSTYSEDIDFVGYAEVLVQSGNEYTIATANCVPSLTYVSPFVPDAATPYVFVDQVISCTETESRITDVYSYNSIPTPPALHGCPGPFFAGDDTVNLEGADVYRNEYTANVLSVPVTKDELALVVSTALAEREALGLPWPDTSCASSYRIQHILLRAENGWPTVGSLAENLPAWPTCTGTETYQIPLWMSMEDVKFRWAVPDDFTGSYFKITWDVLTEPDGWDDTVNDPGYVPPVPNDPPEPVPQIPRPDRPHRTYVTHTWEWTGPGVEVDPDSWKSGWYDIDPPTEPGTRRVVNVRFECYHSPYGTRPQITGEGVEYTEDDVDETPA